MGRKMADLNNVAILDYMRVACMMIWEWMDRMDLGIDGFPCPSPFIIISILPTYTLDLPEEH